MIKNAMDIKNATDYAALREDAINSVKYAMESLEDTLALLNINPVMLDAHECAEALAGLEGTTKLLSLARDAYIRADELEDEWYRNLED